MSSRPFTGGLLCQRTPLRSLKTYVVSFGCVHDSARSPSIGNVPGRIRRGSFPIEGDLAESWQQTNETTYVFKLRKGVRFHAKPPVNGRELTADDVRYTFERILTDKGSANVSMYRSIAKVEALDRYTVRFTLKEPFAWFLDMIANPHGGRHHRPGVRGEVRRPEEAGGGDRHRALDARQLPAERRRSPWCATRSYFVAGLPYIDRVEMMVDEDNASRMAAFLAGKYDLGWEFPGTINRTDWVQIKDRLEEAAPRPADAGVPVQRRERHRHADRQAAVQRRAGAPGHLAGHRPPGHHRRHARGRRASINGPMPAALKEWALPIDQLGEGARYYRHDPAEAKRLLAAAGYPNGFPASMCFSTYGSTVLVDSMQLVLKDLKDGGHRRQARPEGVRRLSGDAAGSGSSTRWSSGPLTPFLEPDNFLFGQYYTGEPRNRSHVNDPVLDDLLVRQRRAADVKARREVINQIQRHLARQQYYVHAAVGHLHRRVGRARSRTTGPTSATTTAGGSSPPGSTAEPTLSERQGDPVMTTRRDFLQTTAGTLAGLVFVGCDLMAARPPGLKGDGAKSWSTASASKRSTSTRIARCPKRWP